ncbi:Hypothetical predicted protein [Pelobates cultripes]|uniref:Uncharacterized protein n=1 Tax=Pelobates cultripes TaxID=61616 RepID=A0AAD1RPI4_PELCU|nr:Hypothetical predicted protein [Pelobates cultripes]
MALVSPVSTSWEQKQPTLTDIGAEIRWLVATMVMKSDLQSLASTLTASITSAVRELQSDVDAQGDCIRADLTATSICSRHSQCVARQHAISPAPLG